MSILTRFIEAAKRRSLAVVLPEGKDDRVLAAARRMKDEGIANPILLGDAAEIERLAAASGLSRRHPDHRSGQERKLGEYTEAAKGRDRPAWRRGWSAALYFAG